MKSKRMDEELQAENLRFDVGLRPWKLEKRADQIRSLPSNLINGKPPRYERLQVFLDFRKYGDPTYTTARLAELTMDEFNRSADASANPDLFDLGMAIQSAHFLVAMRHLQFLGAPTQLDFVDRIPDMTVEYFKRLRPERQTLWSIPIEVCIDGLVITMLADRWQDVVRICNAVKSGIASSNHRLSDDPPTEYAKFLLIFASHFRSRAVSGVKQMESAIAKCRHKRARLLLKIWKSIRQLDQASFSTALEASLEEFAANPVEKADRNDLRKRLPYLESMLHLTALHVGLETPELPDDLSEWLLTGTTTGLAR